MNLVLLTTSGTAASWDDPGGYPAQAGYALSDPALLARGQCLGVPQGLNWHWQGVGYPAATFPMGPSVFAGIAENIRLLQQQYPHPWRFVLDGYSQGAICACRVWRDAILDPAGPLHDRLSDCLGVITYGNPLRAPGIAYGNTLLWGHQIPDNDDGFVTGGIAGPDCLRPEQCLFPDGHPLAGRVAVFDFANPGDLYAAAPIGDDPWQDESVVGHDETLIYNMVQSFDGKNFFAFIKEMVELFIMPFSHVWPIAQAIYNGVLFLGQGANAPHWKYDSLPAINHLTALGMELAGM
jgi:hypothetical protein